MTRRSEPNMSDDKRKADEPIKAYLRCFERCVERKTLMMLREFHEHALLACDVRISELEKQARTTAGGPTG